MQSSIGAARFTVKLTLKKGKTPTCVFYLFRKPRWFSKFTLSWRSLTIRDFAPCEARPTLRALDCDRFLKKAMQKLSKKDLR
jgi:hypothetical protein